MAELPDLWSVYARLQNDLQERDQIDDVTWGLEAKLDRLLTSASTPNDVRRAGESASRKERYQAKLRRMYPSPEYVEPTIESELCAREQLDRIREMVSAPEWDLLADMATGVSYDELAESMNTTTGALRVRIHRLRVRLRAA